MHIARFVTDFGDEAVALPLYVCVGISLLALGWRKGAFAWTVATVSVLGVMLCLKIACAACGSALIAYGIRSPSGHAAAAYLICVGMSVLVSRQRRGLRWTIPLSVLLASAVAASRVAVKAHSVPEVVVGAAVGLLGVLVVALLCGRLRTRIRWKRLSVSLAAIATVVFWLHGTRLDAEPRIRHFAQTNAWTKAACPKRRTQNAENSSSKGFQQLNISLTNINNH